MARGIFSRGQKAGTVPEVEVKREARLGIRRRLRAGRQERANALAMLGMGKELPRKQSELEPKGKSYGVVLPRAREASCAAPRELRALAVAVASHRAPGHEAVLRA